METEKQPYFNDFHSPTCGIINFKGLINKFLQYINSEPGLEYELIIGTDSVINNSHTAEFVSAFVVHRKNSGGIYFWSKRRLTNMHTLRQRIFEEALLSLRLAEQLIMELKEKNLLDFSLIIHVDVGPNGKTKPMIQEIVGMIRGNGFDVKTKPDAYGASSVADRHT